MSDRVRHTPGLVVNAERCVRIHRRPVCAWHISCAVTFALIVAGARGSTPSVPSAELASFGERMAVAAIQDEIRAKRETIVSELRSLASEYLELNRRDDALAAFRRVLALDDTGETDVLSAALCFATGGNPGAATNLLLNWASTYAPNTPSVRLRRAISVFAEASGRSELAEDWRGRATAAGSATESERSSAARWLKWAGFPDVARLEEDAILNSAPDSSTATYYLQARAANAFAIDDLSEAADTYIRTGRRYADSSGVGGSARMAGTAGYACRAMVLDRSGDDEAALAALLCAERWAGGDLSALGRLLWVLEKAPPSPWCVALVRRIAERTGGAMVDAKAAEIAHEARRWLGAKLAGDIILKPTRAPSRDELQALLAGIGDITWVVQDTVDPNLRWIGTEDQFVFVDDTRTWEILRWPETLQDMNRTALAARSAAFSGEAAWIGTDCGLFRYDRRAAEWTQEVITERLVDAVMDVVVMGNETLTVGVIRDGTFERWRYWWDYERWQQD